MDFANVYAQGFARVAVRVLPIRLAQPRPNASAIVEDVKDAHSQGLALVSYPELCLTGTSCGDLFGQEALLQAAEEGIGRIVQASNELAPIIVVGAPVRFRGRVYNCAVVIHQGSVLGVVPKTFGPDSAYEGRRWFAPGDDVDDEVELAGQTAPINPHLLVEAPQLPGFSLHVEVSEDLTGPVPAALLDAVEQGATVVVNLGGDPAALGQAAIRLADAQTISRRYNIAYLFANAGTGESSTDLGWDGQTFVCECGRVLGQSGLFQAGASGTLTDIDLRRLGASQSGWDVDNDRVVASFPSLPTGNIGFFYPVDRFPFMSDPAQVAEDCEQAYAIQTAALVRRMEAIGNPKLVVGVSGGVDSTNVLIVCAKAMDQLGRPRSDILAFTMPGFATSDQTKNSALALMEAVGTTAETIDIRPAAKQILGDLGHPYASGQPVYDVTFENVQAGLRADYLFRIANQRGGFVVGTGDLSEGALGWCTYGVGDHISHYELNGGLPKTMIQQMLRWVATQQMFDDETNQVLDTIVSQEISPELVPSSDGGGLQATESIIGPYALHDFFLYHLMHSVSPSRIAYLAWQAWRDPQLGSWPQAWPEDRRPSYDLPTVRKWLEFFLKRFFANQYKRSAISDGPMVSRGGSLSPRGGWQMPSDAAAQTWLQELADNVPTERIG